MDMAKRWDRITCIMLVALVALCCAALFAPAENTDASGGATQAKALTYKDYDGKNVGILTGTNMEQTTFEYFPNSHYFYYDGYPNMNAALLAGKIDAYLGDEPAMKSIHNQQPDISWLADRLTNNDYSFAFRKNDEQERALRDDFNAWLQEIYSDGTHDEIEDIWFGTDESKKVVPLDDLTGENGTIRVVTTSTDEPFSYIKESKHVGYDIDVCARYARSRGYALEIGDVDFQARIPALESGRYEFTTTMNVTPEREEQVLFSNPVSTGGIVVGVRTSDLGAVEATEGVAGLNVFERIAASFEKNFIREGRFELILQGLQTTCLITVCSAALGSLLSFAICLYRRTGSRLANLVADVFVRIFQGTPMLVVLMILYYVLFAKTSLSAIAVAIIGFTLNLGAYGSEIMRAGIDAVDPGQRQAALAVGYSEWQAFRLFVFPQAALNFMPVLRGEIVNLLKSTSVVGYIAIQDLTKMSDIIRARTFEAFFPLVATAILYFLLAWAITWAMRAIAKRIDPRAKRRHTHHTQEVSA